METKKHRLNFLEPPLDIIDGEPEWEVEKIMGHQQYWNQTQYLIQWKDYSPAYDQWVSKSELHAPELIHQYLAGQ
jgi:hypothetical protein